MRGIYARLEISCTEVRRVIPIGSYQNCFRYGRRFPVIEVVIPGLLRINRSVAGLTTGGQIPKIIIARLEDHSSRTSCRSFDDCVNPSPHARSSIRGLLFNVAEAFRTTPGSRAR
jgi:hypothetical protein